MNQRGLPSSRGPGLALLCLAGAALACASDGGGMSMAGLLPGGSSDGAPLEAPPTVSEQAGQGPVAVYGASVYSPGQKIYKELRQQESLMAFLACQGEPDRVEILDGGDAAPRIVLEYRRRGLAQTGTVEIQPSASGFYAATPIDPQGRLGGAKPPPRRTAPKPEAKPVAKPRPKPAVEPTPPPPPVRTEEALPEAIEEITEEIGGPEAEPVGEAAPPAPPEPTQEQLDDCPIEYWRKDCRDLCVPEAEWEWCQYGE